MIVVDASVVALTFLDPATEPRAVQALEEMRADPAWLVPAHWHVEVLSTVRGLLLGGKIDKEKADRAAAAIQQMTVAVTPSGPLMPRMWELRNNLSTYDAAYVATAESHHITLVTADVRIEKAGVARCPVRVVG
ncbi:type II toxin-antitoxin system VapC family toxin [Nocardioides albus]|uniref:Ribonuclease VapC n=1 Tax=Nocardioides albus TaxID=1841 RepID=A0A7W5F9N7_9ACTN|nr:type II toxin-antitoxin system VapC family toxin [Nocardioides albus]MBB3090415.1 putative nucleic acid-binding protein [Nocardioides albus]GGU23738.1 VapC ribonuclease [Nocardioides albus]